MAATPRVMGVRVRMPIGTRDGMAIMTEVTMTHIQVTANIDNNSGTLENITATMGTKDLSGFALMEIVT
jgi:hypothetical protein